MVSISLRMASVVVVPPLPLEEVGLDGGSLEKDDCCKLVSKYDVIGLQGTKASVEHVEKFTIIHNTSGSCRLMLPVPEWVVSLLKMCIFVNELSGQQQLLGGKACSVSLR
jgi:hypothetical protein